MHNQPDQIVFLAGQLHWTQPLFPSLKASYLTPEGWQFGADRSLLLHVP